jgi:hypothetical protein
MESSVFAPRLVHYPPATTGGQAASLRATGIHAESR